MYLYTVNFRRPFFRRPLITLCPDFVLIRVKKPETRTFFNIVPCNVRCVILNKFYLIKINYQLDFVRPGIKPSWAISLNTWRDKPKSR